MRNKGFTLIELMIVIAIVGILVAVIAGALLGNKNGFGNNVSFGLNGMVENRCINGYQFMVTQRGVTQVMDQFGHGVVCQ